MELIQSENFEKTIDGKPVGLYTLKNGNGMVSQITNYGGRVVSLWLPDKNGLFADVVLGQETITEYLQPSAQYFGAAIGRYGNRIRRGQFTLDRVTYKLATNNGENHLHGGVKGFESVVWDAVQPNENLLELTYLSKDGEEGYPGNVQVKITYELTDEDELSISYEALTDKTTVLNLTHHSFFNLKGEGSTDILDHITQINAHYFTPVDEGQIPTGEILSVKGTPMDFIEPTAIGKNIDADDEQLMAGRGYDHNWVLNIEKGELGWAAKVLEPGSGRVMNVYTTEPGIQFYTGNFLDGAIGKNKNSYPFRSAFCLETQHFPDSPNKKHFPSTVLQPHEKYSSKTVYAFGVQQ